MDVKDATEKKNRHEEEEEEQQGRRIGAGRHFGMCLRMKQKKLTRVGASVVGTGLFLLLLSFFLPSSWLWWEKAWEKACNNGLTGKFLGFWV